MAENNKKTSSKKSIVAQAEAKAEQMSKAKNAKSKNSKGGKKQNRVVKYFKDVRGEFKKVVWPSKKKVINNTTIVVIAMCISSVAIWGVDKGLDAGLAALIKLVTGTTT